MPFFSKFGGGGSHRFGLTRGASAPLTAPTSLALVSRTTTSVTLSFTAPTNTGGLPITNYQFNIDGGSYTAFSPADAETPVTITGLTAGTSYTVTLKAVNAVGAGPASAGLSVTTQAALTVQYVVVAGGGGGGNATDGGRGGGGGGGGYRSSVTGENSGRATAAEAALALSIATNYTVTIGGGGAGGSASGTNGGNSTFATITSTGGGRGGSLNQAPTSGQPGGCGGGGGGNVGGFPGGAGTAGQGFDGAAGTDGSGGGGGGSGSTGLTASPFSGGSGTASAITGTSVTRAAGGKGNNGGSAGGGNTGNGGGASSQAGGSGVVILKYPEDYTITIGAGLGGSTAAASGGFKVTTISSGSGNVSFAS